MTTTQHAFVRLSAESEATADAFRRLIAVLDDLEAQAVARNRQRALWSAYRAMTRRRNRRR